MVDNRRNGGVRAGVQAHAAVAPCGAFCRRIFGITSGRGAAYRAPTRIRLARAMDAKIALTARGAPSARRRYLRRNIAINYIPLNGARSFAQLQLRAAARKWSLSRAGWWAIHGASSRRLLFADSCRWYMPKEKRLSKRESSHLAFCSPAKTHVLARYREALCNVRENGLTAGLAAIVRSDTPAIHACGAITARKINASATAGPCAAMAHLHAHGGVWRHERCGNLCASHRHVVPSTLPRRWRCGGLKKKERTQQRIETCKNVFAPLCDSARQKA